MNHVGTVMFQTFLVLALCGLIIDQACQFMRDRDKRQLQDATAKGFDLLVMKGSARRVL